MNRTTSENQKLVRLPRKIATTPIFDQFIVATVVALVYLPVALYKYAFTDDFLLFFSGEDLTKTYLSGGRPTLALVWSLTHDHVRQVGDLCWVRLIGVVGLSCLASQIYAAAGLMIRDRFVRISLAISVAMLPGLTVFTAWATCCLYPYSAVFAIWAAGLTVRAQRAIDQRRFKRVALLLVVSFALLVLSLWIYQPTTAWFWLVPLMCVLNKRFHFNRSQRWRVARVVGLGFVQFCGLFIVLKLFFILGGIEAQERAGLLRDPVAKFASFTEIQLPIALNQWQVVDVSRKPLVVAIAVASLLTILAGIFTGAMRIRTHVGKDRRRVSQRHRVLIWFGWMTMVGVMVLLSHAHWLATDYSAKNYRTATAFAACFSLLIFWSLIQISNYSRDELMRSKAIRGLMGLLLLVAIMKGTQNLNHYWIGPYSTGFAYLTKQLEERMDSGTQHIHLVRQQAGEGIVTEQNIYTFGRPFSDMEWDWAPDALIRSGLIEASKKNPAADPNGDFEITSSVTGEDFPVDIADSRTLVIDMRELMRWRRR